MNRFPFSNHFPQITTSSSKELYAHGFQGETALVFKTDILKRFPFPEFEEEKYVSLSFAYDEIDRQYKYLLVDKSKFGRSGLFRIAPRRAFDEIISDRTGERPPQKERTRQK